MGFSNLLRSNWVNLVSSTTKNLDLSGYQGKIYKIPIKNFKNLVRSKVFMVDLTRFTQLDLSRFEKPKILVPLAKVNIFSQTHRETTP